MPINRYERGYSFGGFQSTNPDRPLPGGTLDSELENIEASLGETISGLLDIRRDDGRLRNGIVTRDALSADLATGVNPATLWSAGRQYNAQDTVSFDTGFYRCLITHTSNTFSVDLAAGRWEKYAEIGGLASDAEEARDEAVAAAGTAVASAGTASSAAATATTQAGIATTAANSAAASYDLFDDRYLGEKTSLPSVDNDGNALVNGTLVSLTGQTPTSANGMYVRRDGLWVKAADAAQTALGIYRYVATASQTVFSGADADGVALAYSPGSLVVTVNGVTLTKNTYTATNGTSVTLGTAAAAGDVVQIVSFATFQSADFWTKLEADARYAPAGAAGDVTGPALAVDNRIVRFDGTTGKIVKDGGTDAALVQGVLNGLSAAQGAVLYRGAGGWVAIGPGTAGQVLTTGGAGADPSWASAGGGASGSSIDILNYYAGIY